MTTDETLSSNLPVDTLKLPCVDRIYGEPRFHTEGDIAAVAFAPDGSLWTVDDTGVLMHWSADGRPQKRTFLSDLETLWAFSPKGDLLASANDDLLLWDVPTGQLLARIEQPAWVTAVAFSPDGHTLASGHDDGVIRFWDLGSARLIGEFAAHPSEVSALAFDPSGDRLLTAGEDRVLRVWDAGSHQRLGEYISHTDRIPAVVWSATGAYFASAGWDTSARVWRPENTDPLILLNSHADQVLTLAFSPVSLLIATADSDHDIHLWADPLSGQSEKLLRGHLDEIRCLAFSPDGSRLASAGADRVVHVWDVATGDLLAGPNPTGRHTIRTFQRDGQLYLASTGGPQFRVWDAETGVEVAPSGDGPAYSVAASPDGTWLAVGGTDYFTRLYHQPSGRVAKLEATKPPIGDLALHPQGELLAHTSPADGLVWLWKTESAEPMLILIEAADGCTLESVAFHPDGNRVVVGGLDYLSTGERDGAVCVWDLTTRERVATYDRGVNAVAVDPTGRYLAGAGITDRVWVWDLTTDDVALELDGHQERINTIAFSPDGNYLASGGDDQTVRVWDVLSGRLLVARAFPTAIQGLAFSPDGSTLFTGNSDTTCYRMAFKSLLED